MVGLKEGLATHNCSVVVEESHCHRGEQNDNSIPTISANYIPRYRNHWLFSLGSLFEGCFRCHLMGDFSRMSSSIELHLPTQGMFS